MDKSIKTGPGLRQQLEEGYIMYHSSSTIAPSDLATLTTTATSANSSTFTIMTGYAGAQLFSGMLTDMLKDPATIPEESLSFIETAIRKRFKNIKYGTKVDKS